MAVSNLYQSVIFKPKLSKWYSDTQTVICQWKLHNYKTHLDYFCLWSKLTCPGSFEKLHINYIKKLINKSIVIRLCDYKIIRKQNN